MIARNYRQHPEALLQQLELVFGHVLDTIEGIRIKGGAAWENLRARYIGAKPDVRGVPTIPAWAQAMKTRAYALMRAAQRAQMALVGA